MTSSETQKHAANAWLYFSIVFALMVAGFFTWLYWPWPSISTVGPAVVVNQGSGPDGVFRTGDILIWETKEVCQPDGLITVNIWATREFPSENGPITFRTLMAKRDFFSPDNTLSGCAKDNPTTVYIDGNLPTGFYSFEVEACVYNPTPADKCGVFAGPQKVSVQRVVGNQPSTLPIPEGAS